MSNIQIKRAYDKPLPADGYRVLVDRLWPRGVSKVRARLDEWLPAIAPSTELREWFAHDPARFQEFGKRYRAELKKQSLPLATLRARTRKGPVTLIYGARDPLVNHAAVLQQVLKQSRQPAKRPEATVVKSAPD